MEEIELRKHRCCFTGHRPEKLPWGLDEADPRCAALRASIGRELASLYRQGYRDAAESYQELRAFLEKCAICTEEGIKAIYTA